MFSGCPSCFHSWRTVWGVVSPIFQSSVCFLSLTFCGYVTVTKSISNILCQKAAEGARRWSFIRLNTSFPSPQIRSDTNFQLLSGEVDYLTFQKGLHSICGTRVSSEKFKYLNGNPLRRQIVGPCMTVLAGRGRELVVVADQTGKTKQVPVSLAVFYWVPIGQESPG